MTESPPARGRGASTALALLLSCLLAHAAGIAPVPKATAAGVDMVRMQGVLETQSAPDSLIQLTLAIGAKSIPLSVLTAQRMSGMPATAPEIFSALGPGPPPLRVEGRDGMIRKLVDAPAGTRVTIIGNLDVGTASFTLMDVEIDKSAGAQ